MHYEHLKHFLSSTQNGLSFFVFALKKIYCIHLNKFESMGFKVNRNAASSFYLFIPPNAT